MGIVGSLSERNQAVGTDIEAGPSQAAATFDSNRNASVSPRLGLTLKERRQGGGMAARRAKLNLSGIPGLSGQGSRLDIIHNKAEKLVTIK